MLVCDHLKTGEQIWHFFISLRFLEKEKSEKLLVCLPETVLKIH